MGDFKRAQLLYGISAACMMVLASTFRRDIKLLSLYVDYCAACITVAAFDVFLLRCRDTTVVLYCTVPQVPQQQHQLQAF